MSKRYFRLVDDLSEPNRWFLGSPVDGHGNHVDPRVFMAGKRVQIAAPIRMSIRQAGNSLPFSLADFDLPVVQRELGAEIEKLAKSEIQRVPVLIEGIDERFEVLNVVRVVDCLDHTRSQVTYWTSSDGRPEKVGRPRMVINLVVDPAKIGNAQIFRIEDWRIALIVSEQVARILFGVKGMALDPVS